MPNKNYLKGYRFERKVVNKLKRTCIYATRTAGSHSPFDIIAITKEGTLLLIQCKTGEVTNSIVQEAKNKAPNVPGVLNVKKYIMSPNNTEEF